MYSDTEIVAAKKGGSIGRRLLDSGSGNADSAARKWTVILKDWLIKGNG